MQNMTSNEKEAVILIVNMVNDGNWSIRNYFG